jgi:hypothetical protein
VIRQEIFVYKSVGLVDDVKQAERKLKFSQERAGTA